MKFWTWIVCVALVAFAVEAAPCFARGDEDPFPHACINFSGAWQSDQGMLVNINQKGCGLIKMAQSPVRGNDVDLVTIVPDNRVRSLQGKSWTAQVLHRWTEQNDYGTTIESYSTVVYPDRTESTVVQLEIVNQSLLLESTYRKITMNAGGKPLEQNSQEVFRRASVTQQCKMNSWN